ncbi:MAG: 3-dehydroquinate synthase [Saprospiraceae bacterium]|jgi:3-dehydroquinate synthase
MQTIVLDDYNIYVGNIWEPLNNFLIQNSYSKFFIIVDEHTKQHCLPIFQYNTKLNKAVVIEIQSGEKHKNIHTCSFIWKQMIDANADRKALVINLGGGVIGDMGGFCAATYKRGLDFIQIPTTLLSDVDSSIGGKLGIDFADVKNSIGLFKNPRAVFIDPIFLKTLPEREIRSGFAEIIKHCLIADAGQWNQLKHIENVKDIDWEPLLIPSLEIKKRVVEEDPFEQNIRKTLNFGHTAGHAIESWALNSAHPLLHGEAIAAGMVCETYLSTRVTGFSEDAAKEVSSFILKIYGKYALKNEYFSELLHLMKNDKKNQEGKINFTMLNAIGDAEIDQNCEESMVIEGLSYYSGL